MGNPRARAVITGLGVAAPNGVGVDDFWKTILARRSAISAITLFDASRHACRIAGEVKNLDSRKLLPGSVKLRRHARHTDLALVGAYLALTDANVDLKQFSIDRPLLMAAAVTSSAIELVEQGTIRMEQSGPDRIGPFLSRSAHPQAMAATLTEMLATPIRAALLANGCAAGLDAIIYAAEHVRAGRAAIALAGASDSPISPLIYATFAAAGLLSAHNDDPEHASRPFDAHRDSGVLSEGSAFVIVEALDHAKARGARIYAEVRGAASLVDPDPMRPASGFEHTMNLALANSNLMPEDIGYICAHGPSHRVLDRVETECIKSVFDGHAYRIPVSSIKGVVGNPLSAAGPMEVVSTCLALHNRIVPPTANYQHPDPFCDLDYVTEGPRRSATRHALVNTHGIGGANTSLVLEAMDTP